MTVYADEKTLILQGDCVAELSNLNEKADLIITSPPYNMTPRRGGYADKVKRYDSYNDWVPETQYLEWMVGCFDKMGDVLNDDGVILFNFSYSIENPSLPYKVVSEVVTKTEFALVDTIVWKKKNGVPFPANKHRLSRIWEFVFVFAKKGMENSFQIHKKVKKVSKKGQRYYEVVYNYVEARNNDGTNQLNQATFSTDLIGKLLNVYADENTVVLDPFMGTGTTGVSCRKRGIRFIGIELSEQQCEYATKRIVGVER